MDRVYFINHEEQYIKSMWVKSNTTRVNNHTYVNIRWREKPRKDEKKKWEDNSFSLATCSHRISGLGNLGHYESAKRAL